ncbi:cytochrome c-type biogenesis protein [Asticcacaulis biprosthecium]|nr:cytochrome c-type biogenesis protein [Asticcacaulis biprosthecium]
MAENLEPRMNANERQYSSPAPAERRGRVLLTVQRATHLIRVYSRSFAVSILLLLAASSALADPAKDQARAEALFREVRCIQCQSESIADSHAPIAGDMRRQIREDIAAGKDDSQIREELRARYSDYVLFRPRFALSNLMLWVLPPLIVLLGAALLLWLSKRSKASRSYDLTQAETEKLREIMKSDD